MPTRWRHKRTLAIRQRIRQAALPQAAEQVCFLLSVPSFLPIDVFFAPIQIVQFTD